MTIDLSGKCCSNRTPLGDENITKGKARSGVCKAYCETAVDCGGYLYNTQGCYRCGKSSSWGDACQQLSAPKKCTPAGHCVICNDTPVDVFDTLANGRRANLKVYVSNDCNFYSGPATDVVIHANITLKATESVILYGTGAVVQGHLHATAPNVSVEGYFATDTVVTGEVVSATNVTSTRPHGAVVIDNSPRLDATLTNLASTKGNKVVAAIVNANGNVRATGCMNNGIDIALQDALTGKPIAFFSDDSSCKAINLTAYAAVFGKNYQFAFVNGGVFDTAHEAVVLLGWVVILFVVIVASLPLLHEEVMALVALAFDRRHHPHTE